MVYLFSQKRVFTIQRANYTLRKAEKLKMTQRCARIQFVMEDCFNGYSSEFVSGA